MTSGQLTIEDPPERRRLKASARIGVYQIEAVLGEGGMGTVYRALDTKLNRPEQAFSFTGIPSSRFSQMNWPTLRRAAGSSVKLRWPLP